MSSYLVLKLPSWLQILHGQQVVHEVHVRGHLQEWGLWVNTRKAGEELLQIVHHLRADRRQADREVQLIFLHRSAYIPRLLALLCSVWYFYFIYFNFLPKFVFLSKIPKQSRSLMCGI